MRSIIRQFLAPARNKWALLLPGVAFIVLELVLEPNDVAAAVPGLLIWAIFVYLLASLAVALQQRGVWLPGFRSLLFGALGLATLDQLVKLLVLQRLPLEQAIPLILGALAAVMKIINPQLDEPITYNSYRYFVWHEEELLNAWKR